MSDAAPREITTHEPEDGPHRLTLHAIDEPGPGGANHRYAIRATDPPPRDPELAAIPAFPLVDHDIRFQQGPIGEAGVNGLTNEALLAIVADRLEGFQRGEFACHENQQALSHVREALAWLEKRTRERVRRGVEGTHEL